MTRRWLFGVLLCCGCGRFDFDEKIDVEDKAPSLSYPSSIHAVVMQTELAIAPEASGGNLRFTVTPPFPSGVSLNELTGKIKGVPTAAEDRGVHVVTATNDLGSASATIHFTALAGAVVNIFADGGDDDDGQGDAICKSTTAGGCTLRAAFDTVNHLPGKQLIILDAGIYTLNGSLSGLKNDIVIVGAGADRTIVRPSVIYPGYPLIFLDSPRVLRLENLGVRDFSSSDGGALRVSKGSLEVLGAAFENNRAIGNSGGVMCIDGGAKADFESTTFTGNRAVNGSGWGGVINGSGLGTRITVRKSTATDNIAVWGSFSHLETGASLLLENSTLSGNQATRAGTLASPGGEYTLINDTIVNNSVLFSDSAGIYLYSSPARYTMANTILAFNVDINGHQNNCNRNDLATMLVSMGGNVFGDNAGNCSTFLADSDSKEIDPLLDLRGLAGNGGLTKTVALLPGSKALDRGTACPKEDQRGVPRSAPCDAGAFELP